MTKDATIKDASQNSFTLHFVPEVVISDLFSMIDWKQMISISPDSTLQQAVISNVVWNPDTNQV